MKQTSHFCTRTEQNRKILNILIAYIVREKRSDNSYSSTYFLVFSAEKGFQHPEVSAHHRYWWEPTGPARDQHADISEVSDLL